MLLIPLPTKLKFFPFHYISTQPACRNFVPFFTFKSICFIINYCIIFQFFVPINLVFICIFSNYFHCFFLIFFNKDLARGYRALTWYHVRNILAQLCFALDDTQPLGAFVPMHPSFLYPAGWFPFLYIYQHLRTSVDSSFSHLLLLNPTPSIKI